nr:MAG TPA: Putative tail protein [Caudoviricetes sp.]
MCTMEKILKLYTFVDGIEDTPFPNKTEQIVIGDFKYDANGRMGGVPTIEATVKHRLCLDKLWTDKIYASFDGEKFYVKDTPSSSKSNEDERYEHSVTLKSEREVLNHTYFIDAVQGDSTIDGVVSNSLKVQFMGDITQFVARLNASMSYSKIDYTAVIDEGITSESQLVSFEDKYILEALQEIYNVYKLPYYFVGKTIHVGYEQNAIPTVMKYGIDGALLSVSKENANYNLVNRITGVGSSDNIPYYYPNKTPKGEVSINVYSGNQGLTQSDLLLADAVKFAEKVGSTDKCIYSKKSGENVVVINSYEFYNSSTFVDYEANSEISIPVRKEGSAYKSTATFLVNVTILHDASITVNTAFMPINFSLGALSSPSFTIKGYGEEDTQYKVLNNGDKVAAGDYTIKVVFKVSYTGIVSDSVTSAKFYFEASFPSSYYEYWDLNGKEVKLEEIGISLNGSPKLVVGDYFTQNIGKQIPYCTELMPPIYRETEGGQRFYNALNDTYQKPDSDEYYTFENVYSEGNPLEGKVTAEDIKPSIKGMTNAEGLRIDMFTEFAYDENDSDEFDGEKNEYVHPYFFGKLRKFNGEYGFNLFNQASESGNMEFSFTSGMCGSCTFEVGAGDETQKNLVQIDDSGNLLRDENGNVRCGRDGLQKETPQDRQNDTVNYEVWVALKKDDTTYTNVMPNVSKNLKPKAGDTFVILNINMPDSYIYKAENDLKEYLIQYMAENNSEKFNFSIKFSRIFFAEHPDILEQLNENSRLIVEYNKVQYTFYVDNFTYTMSSDSPLPEIEVNLVDTLSIGQNSLQTMLDGVKQDVLSNIGSGDILSQGNKYFLRKDVADSAKGEKTFNDLVKLIDGLEIGTYLSKKSGAKISADGAAELLNLLLRGALTIGDYKKGLKGAKIDEQGVADLLSILVRSGIESANFSTGALGAGFCLKKDENGDSYLEVDRMLVRKVATFIQLLIQQIKHVGGQIILTPASMSCAKVEDKGDFYRCYFENTDGERTIEQEFVVGDLARAQTFNVKEGVNENVTNTYYWRAVVGTGDNYIDLSKTDCDTGSTEPKAGDDIVQLGNKSDATRQAAIILSAYGNDAPYFKLYRGINSYSLDGKEFVSFSRSEVMIIADAIRFSSGESVKDYIDNAVGEVNTKVDDAISDLSENISFVNQLSKDLEAVKNQIDGAIETWFYEPVPTLSNEPAVNWTTNEDKNVHLGDLYYDGNGKAYRFQVSGSKYTWQVITDSDITKALADAKKAQDTADGKRRVFVTTPSNASVYDIGDLWVNATYGSYKNDLLRCKTAKQANAQFSIEHWELASKYTDDTKANQAQAAADAAKQAADSAQQTANNAVQSAATANALLSDIANDNKLTAQEKQETKKEWDIIVSEKPKNNASADKYGVSRTAYDTAYNTLSAYITPLLSSLSTTSNISGAAFRSKFKDYYDARTDLLNAISAKAKSLADAARQTADAAQEKANQAIKDAANAKAAANNAQSDADEAKSRLDSWASDGSISPTEKQSLKEEIARIDADKTQIANGYSKYNLGTPTNYNNAHTTYRAVLVTLTASSPETIAIPSDFATKQTTYYTQRTNALTAISNAARDYAQGIANDLSSYKKTVSSQFEQTNNSITAAVTSSKEYTNNAINNIQIGGRNLFRNTKYGGDWYANNWGTGKYSVSKEQVSENVGGIPLDEVTVSLKTQAGTGDIKMASTSYSNIPYAELENKNVTISFYAKCQENIKTPMSIQIQNKYNGNISSKTLRISELSDNWVKYQYTFPIDKTTNREGCLIFFTISDSSLNKKIYICLLKGEIGNKATDWSPAPEDSENALTEYKKEVTSQFSVLEGEINSKVSSTEITTIKQEIINTAASDATKKANDAKTSAISTASADATSKANKAKQDAISTAATDATNKANKAKNDAITTAGQNADKKYATITTVKSMQTVIEQHSEKLLLKAEKTEVTTVQNNLNQTNNNLSALTTRVSKAEVALQPDNIWIGISSKVTSVSKITNIVPDSCFDDANYSLLYTGGSRVSAATANNSCPTSYCMKSTVGTIYAKSYVNVNVGEKYYVTALVNAEKCNYKVTVGLRIKLKNETYKYIELDAIESKTKGWNTLSGYITIPTDSISASICFSIKGTSNLGEAYFTKVYAYKVDESVNQNYALLTSNEKRLTTFNNVANQRNTLYKTSGLKKGDIVTISFEYEARNLIWNATENSYFRVQFDDKFGWTAYSIPNLKSNGTGKIITPPLTLGGSDTNIKDSNIEMVFYYISSVLQDNKPIGYFRVWNLKVEKGERSTPWSAAPSDYSTTEQIKTGITVKENAISIFGKDVSLQGKITFSSLNSSLQSTINNKADSGDVTSDINSSKEDMAKKLGYASYADMVSAATAGNTIIEGGHIRTSLIEADALVVKTLNATNADGISTLVDKDGMNISKSNNSLLNIYFGNFGPVNYGVINMYSYDKKNDRRSEAIGITPSGIELYTYDGSGAEILRSETRLSFGELKILDESQTGIHIHKTGITLTYSKNKDELGLPVHYVKCIYSAYISSSGSVIDKMGTNIPNSSGNPITFSVSKYATGRYRVKHNIGNTLYHVQITALSNGKLTVAIIENIYSTYFEYSTTSNYNNWSLMDAKVFIAVYYESPKLGTF